jgi:xylulose-5-phosphate/fructose-6-phosphate phosphoketolase
VLNKKSWAVRAPAPRRLWEATRVLGTFLRDVMKLNLGKQNFRLFGPDETALNRLKAVYEVTGKEWMADVESVDIDLSADGRVMEMLSEHMCEGWLEGYLLTGRHGSHVTKPSFTLSIGCSISMPSGLK